MNQGKRMALIVIALIAFVGVGVVQQPIDYLRYDVRSKAQGWNIAELSASKDKKTRNLVFDLPVQFFGAAALGLREAVASLLWVRADEFFHSGQYEAILPLVRLVTWLDPQQIGVYTTGAWHMDYNFVDSEERSDRRYIPPAVKLLEEGIENNPDLYDLYFELAWTHYFQKARKYDKAIYWMKKALDKPARDANTGRIIERPPFVDRMLAHAYEKAGQFGEAEKQWDKCIAQTMAAAKNGDRSSLEEVAVAKKNLGLFLLRRGWRYGDLAAFKRGIQTLDTMPMIDGQQQIALNAAKASLAGWKTPPHDAMPPLDAKAEFTWKKIKPRVIEIDGKLNLVPVEQYKSLASEPYTQWYSREYAQTPAARRRPMRDGGRVRVIFADYDYDYWNLPESATFNWEVDKKQTVLWDDTAIRDGAIQLRIDMSKDPSIYPLQAEKYRLVVWYNPQEAPDFVQDRIGWRGEGLTDQHYLDTKTNPGYRMILKEFTISKRDIM